ncbi:hypothetical protein PIB30_105148 [Stylosanthes scabra]|uniref:Transposase n=1 Tax=Stylosanthes scabra TaxID=79078 RepID=A0ABU6XVG0_9FABA|nr:hypothetical protein [Stylosanthes scabra]
MYDEPWLSWKKIPVDVRERMFEMWVENYTWPASDDEAIKAAFEYRAGRRLQQLQKDIRDGEESRNTWIHPALKKLVLEKFAIDKGFQRHSRINKVNRASARGGSFHTRGSSTIPKTKARMTRLLGRPPIGPNKSNKLEVATQQLADGREESDTFAQVDPDTVLQQTLSKPYMGRVYEEGGSLLVLYTSLHTARPLAPTLLQSMTRLILGKQSRTLARAWSRRVRSSDSHEQSIGHCLIASLSAM